MTKSKSVIIVGIILLVIVSVFLLTKYNTEKKLETIRPENINTLVPLPQETDTIRAFFNIIGERRPLDAIGMMSPKLIGDESSKQAWGVQFNDLDNVKVLSVEKTTTENFYKVNLEVKVNPRAADGPIPYYGWGNNPNTRFVKLIKDSEGLWKIDEIATGL